MKRNDVPVAQYPTLREIIRAAILERYRVAKYDKTQAAISLGISRANMYRKLNEYGVR